MISFIKKLTRWTTTTSMPGPEPAIIFEHADFWIVNKPCGWTVQRDEQVPSVLAWLQNQGGTALPVHRLDKPTSGLLIVARNTAANQALSRAFAERAVEKVYLALSDHKPKKKQGWVKGDMAPARRGQWKLLRSQENPAVTRFQSQLTEEGLRGFALFPKTGKTHQLRVALKSLGSPILGDSLYSGTPADRTYLHAWRLAFSFNQEFYQFEAPAREPLFQRWPHNLLPPKED